MNGFRRIVVGATLVLALLVGGVLFWVDEIARRVIQRGTSEALGVEVSVSSVQLALLRSHFTLEGLQVANPPGFAGDSFLVIGDVDGAFSLRDLFQEKVVVPDMKVANVSVDLERSGTHTNYERVLRSLRRPPPARDGSGLGAEPKSFLLREVRIQNVDADVRMLPELGAVGDAGRLTGLENVKVHVPEIVLRDVGSRGSLTAIVSELTNVIVVAVVDTIAKRATGLPGNMAGDLAGVGGDLGGVSLDIVGEVTQEGGEALGDGIASALGAEAGDATRTITRDAGSALHELGGLVEKETR